MCVVLTHEGREANVSPRPSRRLPEPNLPSEPQGSQLSELVQVKDQEPRARSQPLQLTVMLKDHTQPDL